MRQIPQIQGCPLNIEEPRWQQLVRDRPGRPHTGRGRNRQVGLTRWTHSTDKPYLAPEISPGDGQWFHLADRQPERLVHE